MLNLFVTAANGRVLSFLSYVWAFDNCARGIMIGQN